ncbi:DUF3223 domain-containing protein [Alloalcanivorax xenomutans]|uniref:DUF3223 domain-containing protein n=1 Tax=Alloalcanivorax xenomutans TaxID=1094342 RepID=UPI001F18CA6F|nr:DUF3223 domain-containing protein [Alloalcanivorax xenomutans]MCE7525103.1 DCL family protein [Alloalcanivorax xenomutans]
MPYIIAGEKFKTKDDLKTRCREILANTTDGQYVSEQSLPFLIELFQYHDEWSRKKGDGICGISAQMTTHGTRCFVLVRKDRTSIDISFPHAIRCIPGSRQGGLLPQPLRDFRSAARSAIESQIQEFRNEHLALTPVCLITNIELHRGNCHVDHTPPRTFDTILFEFCRKEKINPLNVEIGSLGGTVAVFEDEALKCNWQSYHRENADLRLLSKIGNLQLPKTRVDWRPLYQ